jgi:hypothetical protein
MKLLPFNRILKNLLIAVLVSSIFVFFVHGGASILSLDFLTRCAITFSLMTAFDLIFQAMQQKNKNKELCK